MSTHQFRAAAWPVATEPREIALVPVSPTLRRSHLLTFTEPNLHWYLASPGCVWETLRPRKGDPMQQLTLQSYKVRKRSWLEWGRGGSSPARTHDVRFRPGTRLSVQGGQTKQGGPSFLPAIWASTPAEAVCHETKGSLFLCWT